jgi:hypothetical protein
MNILISSDEQRVPIGDPWSAAMARWFGSAFERPEVLHAATSCAIWRAAAAMLEHAVNIVAVTDRGVPRQASETDLMSQCARGAQGVVHASLDLRAVLARH